MPGRENPKSVANHENIVMKGTVCRVCVATYPKIAFCMASRSDRSFIVGNKCPYTSSVIAIVECPSRVCTTGEFEAAVNLPADRA